MIPLFKQYPALRENLPWISLGTFPTPVARLSNLGGEIGMDRLYLKQDGESGDVYGGNKVRKLEFVLADALAKGKKAVLTFGYAGSNHALATSIYASKLGLSPTSILLQQPNARYVGKNLLMGHAHRTHLCHYRSDMSAVLPVIFKFVMDTMIIGKSPYIIPPGGSSPLGVVGYVNAAFELREQIEQGILPEPSLIMTALGTMGTAVGLQLGIAAAGLSSKVVSVRVTDEKYANQKKYHALFKKANNLLSAADPSFPRINLSESDIRIQHDFFGGAYARFSPEGMSAVRLLEEKENVSLEGTYTGKTMAALLDKAFVEKSRNDAVLFWNTYNSRDFSDVADKIDYQKLPKQFHQYFKTAYQPLDR